MRGSQFNSLTATEAVIQEKQFRIHKDRLEKIKPLMSVAKDYNEIREFRRDFKFKFGASRKYRKSREQILEY